MSTCKDCIHYELCEDCHKAFWGHNANRQIVVDSTEPERCGFFKDRSKFIELPCKAGDNGDIFWAIDAYVKSPYDYFISPYQCLGIKYGYDCIEGDNTIMLLAVGGREYIFGKEAFFHKEQAEQALKERDSE